jgi:predicted component of type VI protein secretion system
MAFVVCTCDAMGRNCLPTQALVPQEVLGTILEEQRATRMKPIVILETNTRTGAERVHAFDKGPVSLGRGKDSDVQLDADHVSVLHASFLDERGGLTFVDHDSRNGSVVDNVQVDGRSVPVNERTRIRIGDFSLRVSRVLPEGVKARKTSAAARDATAGVAAPPTNILSRSTLDLLRRDGAHAPPVERPIPIQLDEPLPVASAISSASPPTSARPVAAGEASRTKTLMVSDLPDLSVAVAVAAAKNAKASPGPLTATPFPGASHSWFQTDDDGSPATAASPASSDAPSPPRFLRLTAVAIVCLAVGIAAGVGLHASLAGSASDATASPAPAGR